MLEFYNTLSPVKLIIKESNFVELVWSNIKSILLDVIYSVA